MSIVVGTLTFLAVCGTLCSPQKVPVELGSYFLQSGETRVEEPHLKCNLTIPDHPAVDIWVRRFSEECHKSFQTHLDRAGSYVVPVQEIFVNKGLPKDLIYVALVESGFLPCARSRANAVGMWQIVSKTGSRFGLEQDEWIDERRNPMKAAQAAADYLSLLYDKFGSWSLALAAYNAGENAVQGALNKSGFRTFWDLMENRWLPAETCDYVPKVFAAVKIIRNLDLYGFRPGSERVDTLQETVFVPGGLRLSWVGKQIGVPERLLQNFNPELCRSCTPPGCSLCKLCLPVGTGRDLLTAIATHPPREDKPVEKNSVARRSSFLISRSVATRSGKSSSRIRLFDAQGRRVRYLVRRGDILTSVAGKSHVKSRRFLHKTS